MSTKATHIRQSKSSNEQSFQALTDNNERAEQQPSRPSTSSDFDNISDRKMEQSQMQEHKGQRKSNVDKELDNLQQIIIKSEKSIEEQFQVLKMEYQEREKQISCLQGENAQLKKQCHEAQQNVRLYRQELQEARKMLEQQHNVSGSLIKAQSSAEKDFSKKSTMKNMTSFDDYLSEKLKECEFKINSLHSKLEFFTEQDSKVREFLSKTLKFNPSFPMQLSTLVQSAVIQLDSNLKEVNREIENIILCVHLGNANKILARRENTQEERYNHWEVLSNLDVIKEYVNDCYKGK